MAKWTDIPEWTVTDAEEGTDQDDEYGLGKDDGSLTWASSAWMRARGIESVDCHGRFVYAEGFEG